MSAGLIPSIKNYFQPAKPDNFHIGPNQGLVLGSNQDALETLTKQADKTVKIVGTALNTLVEKGEESVKQATAIRTIQQLTSEVRRLKAHREGTAEVLRRSLEDVLLHGKNLNKWDKELSITALESLSDKIRKLDDSIVLLDSESERAQNTKSFENLQNLTTKIVETIRTVKDSDFAKDPTLTQALDELNSAYKELYSSTELYKLQFFAKNATKLEKIAPIFDSFEELLGSNTKALELATSISRSIQGFATQVSQLNSVAFGLDHLIKHEAGIDRLPSEAVQHLGNRRKLDELVSHLVDLVNKGTEAKAREELAAIANKAKADRLTNAVEALFGRVSNLQGTYTNTRAKL